VRRWLHELDWVWKRAKLIAKDDDPQRVEKLARIRLAFEQLRAGRALFFADELDISLLPKVGYQWMPKGVQVEVLTPGTNEKRYLAGALDVRTNEVVWVEGQSKDGYLFVRLLGKLYLRYPWAKRIHVILDNYCIHDCEMVAWPLLEAKGRLSLHFLPPYCPDHNRIERIWKDLHDNVMAACRNALADFKVPREIRFVDEMPRSTLEKVAKAELRKMLG